MEKVLVHLVNDFEFENGASRKETKFRYTNSFKAKISVRVLNLIKEIAIREKSVYTQSVGEYGTPEYVEGFSSMINEISDYGFDQIKEAGIELDYSRVLAAYEVELKAAKVKKELIEYEARVAAEKGRGEDWDNGWIHEFVKENIDHKKLEGKVIELTKETRERVMGGVTMGVTVKYRGISTVIWKEGLQFVWINGVQGYIAENGKVKGRTLGISDHKERRASKGITSVVKFVTAVDMYLNKIERVQNQAQKEEIARNAKAELLTDVLQLPISIEKSWRAGMNRHSQGYEIYEFYCVMNEVKYKVDTNVPYVYNSKTNERNIQPRQFSIRNLDKLSEEKFGAIVEILK